MALEFLNAIDAANEFIDKTEGLDEIMFFSLIATVIDQWCANHDMDSDETRSMTAKLIEIQKEVHSSLGPAKPNNKIGF